jgi:nicotinate-nucleotide adenylyltransferase
VRVGLFGGSFDPIHDGHLKLATAALQQLKLDRVHFVVSPRSPFKAGQRQTPAALRLALVKLALRGRAKLKAADWEMKRRGLSYTVATIRAYRRAHPRDEIFMITGSDALAGFPRWHSPGEIVRLATLVSGRRPGAKWKKLPVAFEKGVQRLHGYFPDVSATEVRRAVAAGRRPRGVAAAIYREIIRRGLYR